jgi:hypothetical protein
MEVMCRGLMMWGGWDARKEPAKGLRIDEILESAEEGDALQRHLWVRSRSIL